MLVLYIGPGYVISPTLNTIFANMTEVNLDESQLGDLGGKVAIVTGT